MSRASRLLDLGWAVLISFVLLGPLLVGSGFWLAGDMVFVPEQPWKDAWLGLDGSLPRAVPMDALVSWLGLVLPGELIQRLLLLMPLVAGGVGAARLCAEQPWFARWGGALLFLWNPWVCERLLIGQWAILAGYCVLPWVVLAAVALRDDVRRGLPGMFIAATLAAVCSPSTGLMAGLVAACLLVFRFRWQSFGALLGCLTLANLSWVLPGLLTDGRIATTEGLFGAFAARAESPAGVIASVASLGGIWKESIVPGERTSVSIVLFSCMLTGVAMVGVRFARLTQDRRTLGGLGLAAAVALVVALLPATSAGADLLDRASGPAPVLTLLRDSHRFLAPLALLLVPGFAGSLTWLRDQAVTGREALLGVVGLLVLMPVLLLPSLAWGAAGELRPVSYPAEWSEVHDLIEADPAKTVVLPWTGSYRGFDWNRDRAVLDPAPRFFPGDVLTDDRTLLGDVTVPSEDPLRQVVGGVLVDPASAASRLRLLGVRWVLVEKGNGADVASLPSGRTVHDGDGLLLVDLGDPAPVPTRKTHQGLVLTANFAVALALIAMIAILWRRSHRLRAA